MNIPKVDEWIRESNLIEEIDSQREDQRCQVAWEWLKEQPWSLATVLDLHKHVMKELDYPIAGRLRSELRTNVQAGGRACPSHRQVDKLMRRWLKKYHICKNSEQIREAHIKFEHIHPFADGNGRVGRMIMNWQHYCLGLPPMLIPYATRQEYYKWFD